MALLGHIARKVGSFNPVRDEDSRLRRKLDSAPPVLVYQMGKVGSSALKKSLAAIWPGLTIQSHTIVEERQHSADVAFVYEIVIRQGAPVFIISPVREPIGRNISAFFHNFERYAGLRQRPSDFAADELIRMFLERYDHDVPLRWFEKNLKPVFGVDIFDYDFPSCGIQVIECRNTKLLLLRCELPDALKESAVKNFLNLSRFRLDRRNIGAQKDYGEAYKSFRNAFIPPDWYLERMYESRFFNHFYGAQKNDWLKKWRRKDAAL